MFIFEKINTENSQIVGFVISLVIPVQQKTVCQADGTYSIAPLKLKTCNAVKCASLATIANADITAIVDGRNGPLTEETEVIA